MTGKEIIFFINALLKLESMLGLEISKSEERFNGIVAITEDNIYFHA